MYRLTLLAALFLTPLCVNADTIEYGDFGNDCFTFVGVTEDTREAGDTSDFGGPTLIGNTLDFDPIDFTASADQNNPSEINDAQVNFTLCAENGKTIGFVDICEGGDFTLAGFDPAQAMVSWGAAIRWDVIEIDGIAVNPISGSTTFGESFSLPGDSGGPTLWDGAISLDVSQFLMDNGLSGSATKIEFAIDNTLVAAAADGGSAFIAKKDVGLKIGVREVPEPSSCILLIGGIAGLLVRRRR